MDADSEHVKKIIIEKLRSCGLTINEQQKVLIEELWENPGIKYKEIVEKRFKYLKKYNDKRLGDDFHELAKSLSKVLKIERGISVKIYKKNFKEIIKKNFLYSFWSTCVKRGELFFLESHKSFQALHEDKSISHQRKSEFFARLSSQVNYNQSRLEQQKYQHEDKQASASDLQGYLVSEQDEQQEQSNLFIDE